ncbi:ABC transporter permease [Mesorhizobium sp. CAU 1741]|uniref:ABC transporter permease n=1 Tax=Mesorhizobium sp. CAU 1741 TaxID=3140366 RepID=UPI00325B59F1
MARQNSLAKTSIDVFKKYSPLLILALLWEFCSRTGLVSQYALPPLTDVLASFRWLTTDTAFFTHAGMSLGRAGLGLLLAVTFGIVMGTLMASFRSVDALVGPLVQTLYPMPKSALIPLTIMWFGLGHSSKIFLIFLGCLLPITIATYNGVKGVDRVLMWSGASLGASRLQRIIDISFMAAQPAILAGLRTSLALSFVLLVSSELVMSNEGLGFLIRMLGDGGLYAEMFAVILTVVAMGFVSDRLIQLLTARVLRWRD